VIFILSVILLVVAVYGCSIWVNLAFTVKDRKNLCYFPPFKPFVNGNDNKHLGAEYYCIARSMVKGEGFANPFKEKTGPTAWMPPILPAILAGIIWACEDDESAIIAVVVFLQVNVLLATGLLVLALVRQTASLLGAGTAVVAFLIGLVCHFRSCFQNTHDCWLVMLAVNLLIAGLCWWRPLHSWPMAVVWGLCGGLFAMINPLVALAWGVTTLVLGYQQRAWRPLGVAVLAAGITLMPWTVRNYLVFGKLIPVKSNLAYELYQSQCRQKDGLIRDGTFASHPYASAGEERREYKAVGEMAFLEHKSAQFWQAVWADPEDFLDRVAARFLGVTLWYVPYSRQEETPRVKPDEEIWRLTQLWFCRLTHPLPFLALLFLIFSAFWEPLRPAQGFVIAVYLCYFLPYIGVSFYERYAVPMIGVKVLLVVWGADRLLALVFRRAPTGQAQVWMGATAERQEATLVEP
jgi:hypothetical protein